ncbi:MAG TPA: 1-(5-phosphoribosyl)-5-[(5-phosphoribosylamino)methylideneamino]imidazole-4-carboxamide isomerase [Solirubrobacterales bacterium]|nr:1-(5-phosphoribosyl)-5-[(5-phosphoribosylamino)methylideneamino]imidazole-4-carboxamide isomerase [Solirubrobacterales bacterium]
MILYPAIDIRGGRAVRLLRGDYDRETVYDADPVDAARRWVAQGARFLHVVDLDGAREGRPVNLDHVRRIATAVDVPIQLGGGLRDAASAQAGIAAGAARVVLGTGALERPELVEALAGEHGDRIVISVDARQGRVAIAGWEQDTKAEPGALIASLADRGVGRFVYTPVDVDGTMEGPGLAELPAVAGATDAELIYSGGVGSLDDLAALRDLGLPNLAGVIVGRALYEGRFTVAEGQSVLDGSAD